MPLSAASAAWWQHPEWVSAIATVAAVVAAFLLFIATRHLLKARLRIHLVPDPPDWSSGLVANSEAPDGPERVFVVRLRVENRGPDAARNVEAVVHGLRRKQDGRWVDAATFLPSTLRWTHVGDRQLPLLLPKTTRHLDLADIRRTTHIGQDAVFVFALAPMPTFVYYLLHPGEYRFSVTVAAENARPRRADFELRLTGDWDPEDAVMAKKGLTLQKT